MSKEMKDKIVPNLRFWEFRNQKGWKITPLSRLGEVISGLTYSPDDVREAGLLVLRSSNIKNGEIVLDDCVYVDFGVRGANLSKPDDILVCVRNGSKPLIGKNALIQRGVPTSTHGAFMSVFRAAAYPKFVFQLFQTDSYFKQVSNNLGATINSINNSNFIKYKFYVPEPHEQQKIADCLSSLDVLITAQIQKLEALKAHKKGLMQQLFPAEDETVPKLRFAEFKNSEEWNLMNIGEVVTEQPRPIEMADEHYYNLVTVKRRYGGIISRGTFKGESIKVKSQFLLKKNDFLISKRQIVHNACGIVPESLEGSIVSNEYSVLIAKPGNDIVFFYYFSQQNRVGQSFIECSVGIVIEKMLFKLEEWLKRKFLFPSLAEQRRIANCLSSLDESIKEQGEKIELLKSHKKGLMQQLFPSINESQDEQPE